MRAHRVTYTIKRGLEFRGSNVESLLTNRSCQHRNPTLAAVSIIDHAINAIASDAISMYPIQPQLHGSILHNDVGLQINVSKPSNESLPHGTR
jgi:hypothetical protein